MHSHHFPTRRSSSTRSRADRQMMGDERRDDGAILVEYAMVLVAILLVSIALIQFIGGRVLEMFQGVLPAFGG